MPIYDYIKPIARSLAPAFVAATSAATPTAIPTAITTTIPTATPIPTSNTTKPKFDNLTEAAYFGGTTDIKALLLRNSSPYNIRCKIDIEHRKNASQDLIYPLYGDHYVHYLFESYKKTLKEDLYIDPIRAAIFARKMDNLQLILENVSQDTLLKFSTGLQDFAMDNAFRVAKKLGVVHASYLLSKHAIKAVDFYEADGGWPTQASKLIGEIFEGFDSGKFTENEIEDLAKTLFQYLPDEQKVTMLFILAERGYVTAVKVFLDNGVCVNSVFSRPKVSNAVGIYSKYISNGITLIELILSSGYLNADLVKLLFDYDLNVTIRNPNTNRLPIDFCENQVVKDLFLEQNDRMLKRQQASRNTKAADDTKIMQASPRLYSAA